MIQVAEQISDRAWKQAHLSYRNADLDPVALSNAYNRVIPHDFFNVIVAHVYRTVRYETGRL